MKNTKTFNSYISLLTFAFFLLTFFGCATAPVREGLPTYNIRGSRYLALIPLCSQKGIEVEYDTFSRIAVLTKGSHRINLRVGETLVLVDAEEKYLNEPVELYQGALAVPYKFKEVALDPLFGQPYPSRRINVQNLKIRKIIVDAGHGGTDPGAIGRSGLREKDVNLDIAKRVTKLLKEEGLEVVMTRSTDKFIPLSKRVDIANNARADIFVAVHSNANHVRSLNGFEVYYVSPTVNDSKRAYTAARNAHLNLESVCLLNNSLDLKATLWDMIYTANRSESVELSRTICKSMQRDLDLRILGVKGARFEVLRGTRMPAVLVEVGFLSNSEEERKLKNGFYRQKLAEALVKGLLDYARDFTLLEAQNR